MHFSKPTECTIPRVTSAWPLGDNDLSLHVLQLRQMYHLVGRVDGGLLERGDRNVWEIYTFHLI